MSKLSLEDGLRTGWLTFTNRIGFWMLLAVPSVLTGAMEHTAWYEALKGPPKIALGLSLGVMGLVMSAVTTVVSLRDVGVFSKDEPGGSRLGHVLWVSFILLLVCGGVVGATLSVPFMLIKTSFAVHANAILLGALALLTLEAVAIVILSIVFWPYNFVAAEQQGAVWSVMGHAADLTRGRRGLLCLFFLLRIMLSVPARFTFGLSEFLVFPVMTLAAAALYRQIRAEPPSAI